MKKTFVYYVDTAGELAEAIPNILKSRKADMLEQLTEQFSVEFYGKDIGFIVIDRPGKPNELELITLRDDATTSTYAFQEQGKW